MTICSQVVGSGNQSVSSALDFSKPYLKVLLALLGLLPFGIGLRRRQGLSAALQYGKSLFNQFDGLSKFLACRPPASQSRLLVRRWLLRRYNPRLPALDDPPGLFIDSLNRLGVSRRLEKVCS